MGPKVDSIGNELAAAMGRASLYKLDATKIAAAAYSDQPGAEVEPNGTNTAVALARIKLGYDEAFERIEKDILFLPKVCAIRDEMFRKPMTSQRKVPPGFRKPNAGIISGSPDCRLTTDD